MNQREWETVCRETLFRSFRPLDARYCGEPVAAVVEGKPLCKEHYEKTKAWADKVAAAKEDRA